MHNPSPSKHAGYYEAVVQLRPARQEIADLVYRMVKKKPQAWIAREEDLATGKDIYLSDRKLAMGIGRQLKKQFKGVLVISRTLHTYDKEKSKNVYRMTILFRAA